jgi:hypothetical protein
MMSVFYHKSPREALRFGVRHIDGRTARRGPGRAALDVS